MQKSILLDFRNNFRFLTADKIALYGTGQYTELIVKNAKEFCIAGLLDAKRTGEVVYGLPVLELDEVVRQDIKTIIIVSNLSVASDIYDRIREFSEKHSVVVYYLNGRRAGLIDSKPADCPYWDVNKEILFREIRENDVISFDLFDTLIMRKCLYPTEVFWILAKRAEGKGIILKDFVKQRQDAEKNLYHNVELFYGLHDIYLYLKTIYGFDDAVAAELEQLEFQIEKELIVSRNEMCHIFSCAKKLGKTVIVCTDMYLSYGQITEILDNCGIYPDKLYISNERKASKHIGNLYEQILKEYKGKKLLHIGDNVHSDIENAAKHGVNTFYVASAEKLMELTRCSEWKLQTETASEHYTYELWAQNAFNNPFAGAYSGGKISIESPEQYGYLFFGPLVLGYMSWLLKMIKTQQLDCILFVSRDGYIFYEIYEQIRKRENSNLPKAVYFYTSRRAASVAAIRDEKDIEFVVQKTCNVAETFFEDLIENTFAVLCDKEDEYRGMRIGDIGKDRILSHIKERYMYTILQNALSEREKYCRYLQETQIAAYKRLGLMNFVGRGVTQKCLSKIIDGADLVGLYFALEYDADDILQEGDEAFSWYLQKMSTHTATDNVFINYLRGERVFSAPHGSLVSFDEMGKPIFKQNVGESYEGLLRVHKGIKEYVEDMQGVFTEIDEIMISSQFADCLLGMLDREKIKLHEDVLKYHIF